MSSDPVELRGGEPSGLAEMIAGLLRSNLAREPGRVGLLSRATISITARDARVRVLVRLRPGRAVVSDLPVVGGATPGDVRISAPADDLLALASAPLRLGFPDPIRPEGRAVLRAIASGRVRIAGMLRHPLVLSRFARLLSAR